MSVTVAITVNDQASAKLATLAPEQVLPRLARTMDYQNQLTVANIQQRYLSYPKDDPTVPTGLRVISNRLRSSINASPTAIVGDGLQSAIGSNVVYAALHEFGGIIHHPARKGSVRLRTKANGDLLRTGPNGKLAIFASRDHKRFKTVEYEGKEYDVTYPARAFVQNGIRDRLDAYGAAFSETIVGGVN